MSVFNNYTIVYHLHADEYTRRSIDDKIMIIILEKEEKRLNLNTL